MSPPGGDAVNESPGDPVETPHTHGWRFPDWTRNLIQPQDDREPVNPAVKIAADLFRAS